MVLTKKRSTSSEAASMRKSNQGIRLSKLGKKTTTEVGKRLEEIENEKLNADANLKESDSPFWYHGIPDELLMGIELDLSNWSVVAFDTCIEKIGVGTFKKRSGAKGKQSNQIADLIDTRLTLSRSLQLRSVGSPKLVFPSVIHINLRGADHITDRAVISIGTRFGATLKYLNLEKATQITDVGIKHLIAHCKVLQVLNLNYLTNISGAVINLLANTGFPLLEIGLAGCSQIPEANLIQFFELSGNFLETVDLSFCSQVTDELLFTLGRQKKTPKLQVLKLKGCHQVSDGGILSVTSGCSELTTLDLMRYDLQYKINDIVLLSLAEKCRLLQYITFAGCDMLTDAGLSWMVTGCHAIVDLDLSNCSKVTDVGLRSIGEYLIHLKQLILKNCVRISDLGLRHVAMGCLELTTLDLTNCALISDSSSAGITYPASALASLTLSKNRAPMSSSNTQSLANMGVEPYIVGLAAIAKYSAKLKHLDLTKCSLVSEAALLELAKNCKHLSSLSLYGCHRVTNRSVMKLLSHCHELTVLNLTDCSKISDVAFHQLFQLDEDEKKLLLNDVKQKMRRRSTIRALASFHPGGGYTLVSLRLRNCALISDKTIKRISDACQNLRDLDLSGCHTLTDLALLWLAESEFLATNLRKLWLRDLTNITNTGLSWLVSKQQNVRFFLLDVTGCTGLALSSIQALADFFPFANFRNEKGAHAFRGFFPKHRAEDRFLIEEYGACWRAAIKIQCIYRGRVAYKIARVKRQEALFRWAITKIQSSFRRRQAQKIAIVLKIQRQKEIEAAIRIQRFFRRFLHARQAEIEAEKHYVAYCNVCAIKIQTNWRRKKCRYHFLTYQEMKRAVEAKKLRAIITCQRLWRVKKARNYWHCLQEWTKEFIQCQNKAAKQLQALIRQRAARKEVDHRRKEKLTFKRQQEMAAIKCQKHIRRHQAKKRKQNEENELKKHEESVRKIQKKWRQRKHQFHYHGMQMLRQHRRKTQFVIKLQNRWRTRQSITMRQALQLEKERLQVELEKNTIKIQKKWRAKQVKRHVQRLEMEKMVEILQQIKLKNDSAIKIQAMFRGKLGRRKVMEYRHLRKYRWKEITTSKKAAEELEKEIEKLPPGILTSTKLRKNRFYYNKETGEVRFFMPQDLLDLLPHPVCNNCDIEKSKADVECRDCEEFYCKTCWDKVHAGGKRKRHSFRCLFDYFQKRIEYDDIEFPSKWPSEIQQDEMDGWFLRSYPHRQPIETRPDGWERYLDEPSGREWFYNKYTQESQYFAPQVFLSDRESHLAPKSDQKPTENGLEEWAKYFDAQSGYEYYYNHKTLESTYSRPVEYFTPRDAPLVSSRLEKGDKDWAKYFDPVSGHNYYYNHRTMESSFSRPIDFFTPRATPRFDETPLESGGNGWGKYYDATTQGHYYYNAMTNESSYMRPQEFATPRASENGKAEEPGQLEKYLDQESGQYYYYNRSTTEVKRVAPG